MSWTTEFHDTFVEGSPPKSLVSHTPDLGSSWSIVANGPVFTINPTGSVEMTTGAVSGISMIRANPDLSSQVAFWQATFKALSYRGNPGFIMQFTSNLLYLELFLQAGSSNVGVRLKGVGAAIGNFNEALPAINPWNLGDSHTLRVECSASQQLIYLDGSLVATKTHDLSGTTGKGHGLINEGGPDAVNTGFHITDYQAGTVVTPGGSGIHDLVLEGGALDEGGGSIGSEIVLEG